MLNKIIALAIAAGFATASFAQTGNTAAPATPAPAAAQKKAEAPQPQAKIIKVKHHTGKKAGTPATAKAEAAPVAK